MEMICINIFGKTICGQILKNILTERKEKRYKINFV